MIVLRCGMREEGTIEFIGAKYHAFTLMVNLWAVCV
jgi:hypothetical protein